MEYHPPGNAATGLRCSRFQVQGSKLKLRSQKCKGLRRSTPSSDLIAKTFNSVKLSNRAKTLNPEPRTLNGRAKASPLLLAQHLMDKRDRDRALSDGRCDTLDIPAPDIADSEHSGQTG